MQDECTYRLVVSRITTRTPPNILPYAVSCDAHKVAVMAFEILNQNKAQTVKNFTDVKVRKLTTTGPLRAPEMPSKLICSVETKRAGRTLERVDWPWCEAKPSRLSHLLSYEANERANVVNGGTNHPARSRLFSECDGFAVGLLSHPSARDVQYIKQCQHDDSDNAHQKLTCTATQ